MTRADSNMTFFSVLLTDEYEMAHTIHQTHLCFDNTYYSLFNSKVWLKFCLFGAFLMLTLL